MTDKPRSLEKAPIPTPIEKKERRIDIRRDSTREQPAATPKPPTQPKRETVRTGPKKGA